MPKTKAQKQNGLESAPTDQALTPEVEPSTKEAYKIMRQIEGYDLIRTRRNSDPNVFSALAAVVAAIYRFRGRCIFGWQKYGSGLAARFLIDHVVPRLVIDVFQERGSRILVSLHTPDDLRIPHDRWMPAYVPDFALEIARATKFSPLLRFKQESLQSVHAGGDHHE